MKIEDAKSTSITDTVVYFGIQKLQQLIKTVGKAPPNIIYGHPYFHLSVIVSMSSQTDNMVNIGMTQQTDKLSLSATKESSHNMGN